MSDESEARGRAALRRAGHVLVDMLVAISGDNRQLNDEEVRAVMLACERIYEIDAIRVTPVPDDPEGGYSVDVSPLLNAALNLLHWLAVNLARRAEAEYDDVLLDLRQQLDDWEREAGQQTTSET